MICDECKTDRSDSDFINSKNICYKCLYRIKVENMRKSKSKKTVLCRICGAKVERKKGTKKHERRIFCSNECAKEGHQKQVNSHWTRKLALEKPKKRRNYSWTPTSHKLTQLEKQWEKFTEMPKLAESDTSSLETLTVRSEEI